jgi:hypothetical protein
VFDPTFERTVQVQDVVGDSQPVSAAAFALDPNLHLPLATVPFGQYWLIERISGRYTPGAAPTDPIVELTFSANGHSRADLREGTELLPSAGWAGVTSFDFFADESSPVRFFPFEQIFANVPIYATGARLTVTLQVRATVLLGGDSGPGVETLGIEPVHPSEQTPPDLNAWN